MTKIGLIYWWEDSQGEGRRRREDGLKRSSLEVR